MSNPLGPQSSPQIPLSSQLSFVPPRSDTPEFFLCKSTHCTGPAQLPHLVWHSSPITTYPPLPSLRFPRPQLVYRAPFPPGTALQHDKWLSEPCKGWAPFCTSFGAASISLTSFSPGRDLTKGLRRTCESHRPEPTPEGALLCGSISDDLQQNGSSTCPQRLLR